jgi:NitT/TauT family transport system substrate-binding protein
VIGLNEVGTAMLQDGMFVREDWITEAKNQDTAVKFLRASFKGWLFCRDHHDEWVNTVVNNGPTLGMGHRTWMLNEINALIWPSPNGIGLMDPKAFEQTAHIAQQYQIIKNTPDAGAFRTDLAQKALDSLNGQGLDTEGVNFKKRLVQVTKGGE